MENHHSEYTNFFQDRSNCLIEAAKGGHTEIVKVLLEYPKSVTQRIAPINSVEPLLNEEGGEEEEEGLTTTIPNSFSLPSTPGLFVFFR